MDARHLEAEEACAGSVVDQVGAGIRELGEGCADIGDLVRDMVHSRPALREEPADGRVVGERLEQLDAAVADAQRCCTHALALDGRTMLDPRTEDALVGRERLLEVLHGNAEMMDALCSH